MITQTMDEYLNLSRYKLGGGITVYYYTEPII